MPPAEEAPQKVLQYAVCLVVVTGDYARLHGVAAGPQQRWQGNGWAAAMMLVPAAGYLLAGSVDVFTDRHVHLREVPGPGAEGLVERVRAVMADNPHDVTAHWTAMATVEGSLRRFLPVDLEGELVNAVVAYIETTPTCSVSRRSATGSASAIGRCSVLERRRLGLTPKWLIQRRRLQEVAQRLREGSNDAGL